MGLRGYLLKRLFNTVVLVIFIILLNFFIFELLPGDVAAIDFLATNPRLPAATRDALIAREETRLGLRCGTTANGQPIPCSILTKFSRYFVQMVTFQFGNSFSSNYPVVHDIIASGKLVNTLLLLGTSSVLAILIGVFLGVIAARRRGGAFDSTMVTMSLTTYSLPTFWIGLVLIFVFSYILGWFPAAGSVPSIWADPRYGPKNFLDVIVGYLQHLFLPALTLTLFFYGGFLLLTRATMMEALSEDYITTARAKGLPERTVLYKHALKNASLPLVTAAALQFGFLLSGAIITETVFSYDGLGKWLFDSIENRDGPVIQAMFYIIALMVVIANLAADLMYGLLDPRIKYE